MAYTGNVEIISGLKPKNGANFPLIDAEHVFVSDEMNLGQLVDGLSAEGKSIKDLIISRTEAATTAAETFGERIDVLERAAGATAEIGSMVEMEDDPEHHLVVKDNDGDAMFYIDADGTGQFPAGLYAPNIDKLASMVGPLPVREQINDAIRREAIARDDAIYTLEKRCNKIDNSIDSLKLATYRISGAWDTKTETTTDPETGITTSRSVPNYEILYLSTPNLSKFARVEAVSTPDPDDPENNPPTIDRKIRFYYDVQTPSGKVSELADKIEFLLNRTGFTYSEDWRTA